MTLIKQILSTWLLVAALAAAPACKKEKQSTGPTSPSTGPASSVDAPGSHTSPQRAPSRRRIAVSPKVLPIPADMPALRFNVAKLRTTAWFKRSEAQIRKTLIAPSRIADAMKACGVDPIKNVEGATVGASLAKGRLGDLVAVLKIHRPTDKTVGCMKKHLAKQQLQPQDIVVAARRGFSIRLGGRDHAIIILRSNQLLIIVGKLQDRVAAVLTGKVPSIASTALYNEVNRQVGADSLFGGIFPGLPSGDEKRLPPLLRKIGAGALLVSLPKGKAALRINLRFEDKEKAHTITKRLPALLRLAGSRYPGMKDADTAAKAKPEKGWAYVDFKLEARTFNQVMALLEGILLPRQAEPRKQP